MAPVHRLKPPAAAAAPQALAIVAEEGLNSLWGRHEAAHLRLWAGLTELGLEPYVEDVDER